MRGPWRMAGPCDPLKSYIESKLPTGFVAAVDFEESSLICTIAEQGTARFSFRRFPIPDPDGVGACIERVAGWAVKAALVMCGETERAGSNMSGGMQ